MIRALLALVAFALIQDPPAPKPPEAKPAETKPQEKEKKKLTEAEEFLKKVEEKATKAKTLRCKAKMTMTEGGQEMEFDIEASMAAEGKFKLSMEGEMMGKAMQVAVICDGKKMATEGEGPFGGRPKEPADAPKGAGEGMRLLFVRVGSITTMLMAEFRNKDDETELKDLFDVSDLKFGKEEKIKDRATKVLEYSLTFTGKQGGNNNTAEAKLWIDAETLAPVKREITGPRGETFTETFSDWRLDEELKDSLFELPKDK
jgi:outer membrane lipoprotein-sorting protein